MFYISIPKDITIETGLNWIKIKNNLTNDYVIKKKKESTFLKYAFNKLYLLNNDLKKVIVLQYLKKVIKGLQTGYSLKLHVIGVGYRIQINGQVLTFKLGFSHEINYELPKNVKMILPKERSSIYLLTSSDYDSLKTIGSKIRSLKKPEPYKGKGIRYFNEKIIYKVGKKNSI